MKKPGFKQMALFLPEELHKKLKHICVDSGETMAEMILRLIVEALEKDGKN